MADCMLNENVEEDHYIQDFFPKKVPYHLKNLIAYRIKLLAKSDTIIGGGETQIINTTCLMNGKSRHSMSMFLTPCESFPLSFESSGYIEEKFTGRVMIKVKNYTVNTVKISAGDILGYIAMQQYTL